MPDRRSVIPPPAPPKAGVHGTNALLFALRQYAFPCDLERLKSQAGEDTVEFRRDQPVKVREVLGLVDKPQHFLTPEDAVGVMIGVLDERRGADRRIAPPRSGRTDVLPY